MNRRQSVGGCGSISNSGSIEIPAIEITKDTDYMCDNDDYIDDTPSSGQRSIQQQIHQQVSPNYNIDNAKLKKTKTNQIHT